MDDRHNISKSYEVIPPQTERVYFVSVAEWLYLKRKILSIKDSSNNYYALGFLFLGVFIPLLVIAIINEFSTDRARIVTWAFLVITFAIGCLLLFFGTRVRSMQSVHSNDIIEQMELIEERFQKNAEPPADQKKKEEKKEIDLQSSDQVRINLPPETDADRVRRQITRLFEITDKFFDQTSDPQKIVVEFINRGEKTIDVLQVKYSETGFGLPASALSLSYSKLDGHHYIIPTHPAKPSIPPLGKFQIELLLAQKWEPSAINRFAGQWGYLFIEVVYEENTAELFYPF